MDTIALKDVTTKIGSGATPRGGSNAYKKEGMTLIRSQNVLDLSFNYDVALIDQEQADKLSSVEVFEGDVLINITGDSVARVCIVPPEVLPARVNQHVAILRVDPLSYSSKFLQYFLIANKRHLLLISEIGGTRRAITKGMLEDLLIPDIELSVQESIAHSLSLLDAKIDLLRQQNETLEALGAAVFREWFSTEPKDAEWEKLEEYVVVHRGLSYKGSGLAEVGEGLPMQNLNSVKEGGGYKYKGIKYYNGVYKERHIVKTGDIVVTNTEQGHELLLIGYPAIIPPYYGDTGIFSQHLYKLEIKKTLSEIFLYYLLMSHDVREQLAGSTNGSTVNMMPKNGIEWAEFKCPPEALIEKFTNFATPLRVKIWQNAFSIRDLKQTRDLLLPKLMSGQVKVRTDG